MSVISAFRLVVSCFVAFRGNPTQNPRGDILLYLSKDGNTLTEEEHDSSPDGSEKKESQVLDSLSDAEALLACRAYLQRRKRWGPWIKAEQRKALRRRLVGNMKETYRFSDHGVFWEDPSQLKYLNRRFEVPFDMAPLVLSDGNDHGALNGKIQSGVEKTKQEKLGQEDGDEEVTWDSVKIHGAMVRNGFFPRAEDDRLLLDAAEELSPFFDGGPSPEHVRRSEAAQRTWADPEWKSNWHHKRWGTRPESKSSAEARKQRRIENRLRQLDPNILEHEALANMTEEEVTLALLQHIEVGKKRKKADEGKGASSEGALLNDTEASMKPAPALERFVSDDENKKRELQKSRSDRARRAYQTRLDNQKGNPTMPTLRAAASTQSAMKINNGQVSIAAASPAAALQRIEYCLTRGSLPESLDVRSILEPARMRGRRKILLDILWRGFGLRGKCIPSDLVQHSESFKFATTVSIAELGQFVLFQLSTLSGKSGN